MNPYIVEANDTFAIISRKVYGLESDAQLIASANPDALEPLTAGTSLIIPPASARITAPLSGASNETLLFINETEFKNWQTFNLKKRIDGFSSVSFTAPFDPNDAQTRANFRPFSYSTIIFAIGSEIQFVGNMITVKPSTNASSQTLSVSGYSRAAVLNDCNYPASALPLEFNEQKLDDIATALCNSLALRPVFEADVGGRFDRIAANPDENAFSFLAKIAKQRGLIIRDNSDGQPVFLKSITDAEPVAILHEGDPALTSVTPQFNAQAYYSHITALSSTAIGDEGQQYTAKNEKLNTVFRPNTFKPNDTNKQNAQEAATAKMGRMFANAVKYSIKVPSWRNANGDLWDVNTMISVLSPGAMIYNETKFLVREIDFSRTKNDETAIISLVLPGAFSGEIPEVLPWD